MRKRGTDLEIFVDMLKTHCPRVHALIRVPEPLPSTMTESSGRGSAPMSLALRDSFSPLPSSTGSQGARSMTERAIDTRMREVASRIENCLTDSHFGPFHFVRQLNTLIHSGVDVASVRFDGGLLLMHRVIKMDRIEYLQVLRYTGEWNRLWNLRIDCESGPFTRLTPVEYATKLKKTKLVEALNEITMQEHSLLEIEQCARAGDVLAFRDIKSGYQQHIVDSIQSVRSVLKYACQSGVIEMVLEVIQTERDFGCNRQSVDPEITLCVQLGFHHLIEALIQYGSVNVNQVTIDGKSLTEQAAINGDIDTFRELEHLGAIPSDTVLALASAQNRYPFLQNLLSGNHLHYKFNFQDRHMKSAAHFAAEKGNAGVVHMLLEKGLDINLKDKRGFTILHSAASSGSVPTVQAVIDACERQHVLPHMLTSRDLGSERCFLVRGRDLGQPAWHYVEADRGLLDIFRKRTRGGAVDVANFGTVKRSGWGTNPNPHVVQEVEGMYDVVNVYANRPEDMQPLHIAIIKSHEPVALKLISMMQDVREPDCFGLTPLHLAAMRGQVNVIRALLAKGAQHELTDVRGRTPCDIATANDQPEAEKLLKMHMQVDAAEDLRLEFQVVCRDLQRQRLEQMIHEGGDLGGYLKAKCRDFISTLHDFLYDVLHQTPVVTESALHQKPSGAN